jgi:hypothetical protein
MSELTVFHKEVNAPLRPGHAAIAAVQESRASNPLLKRVK